MRISLVTRLTLLIAMVIVAALLMLVLVFHNSTSRAYVESRNEVKLTESTELDAQRQLIRMIELAFERGGWPEVTAIISGPETTKSIGPATFVIFDPQFQVKAVTDEALNSSVITQDEDGAFRLVSQSDLAEGEAQFELVTQDVPLLQKPDGSEFGRIFLFPTPIDSDAGEVFAGQVWQSAAVWLMLTLAVSMVTAWLLVRRSLKPIARLTVAASHLQSGKIPDQIEVEGDIEFQALITTFNSATRSLAETNKLRKQLISEIAHELRTPVTNIKGQLEAAESGLITNHSEMISTLRAESKLLERLINDFQQLAVSDAGQLKIHLTKLPVAELLLEILSPLVEQSLAKLEINIPDAIFISADSERMRQVFSNLMENSIRHQKDQLVIQLAAERSNEFVTIIFSDNGPGVDEQDQEYIFDRFYRAEKSRNRSTGGSGLGLSIVRALVEAMNGSILYSANSPAGARFEIKLPAAQIETLPGR